MSESRPPRSHQSGVFQTSEPLRSAKDTPPPPLEELSLQSVHEIRLMLRGESVVDWHRLDLEGPNEAKRLLRLNALDPEIEDDQNRIAEVRRQAVTYIRETLRLKLDDKVASESDIVDLLLMASDDTKLQRQACTLLKVMHIIYHLDARELRTTLPISDNELFELVESSVVHMFDELRAAGVPVVEFSWSRKTRGSQITKLLIKKRTNAARVFDRLRFRLIVESAEDLVSTLHVMLQRCIPFNYIVPTQTVNTLIDDRHVGTFDLEAPAPSTTTADANDQAAQQVEHNEFSSQEFRILNFVADLPVRVDNLLSDAQRALLPGDRGRVVFVLAEFQIMDRPTAEANEQGESNHAAYKNRQHSRVKERLLKAPSDHTNH